MLRARLGSWARSDTEPIASSPEQRLLLIATHLLGVVPPARDRSALCETIDSGVHGVSRGVSEEAAYLALAVLRGEIPLSAEVVRARRQWQSEGFASLVERELGGVRLRPRPPVRVSSGVVIDVTDTSRSPFITGIQRVARESVARWPGGELELLAFDPARPMLRALTTEEKEAFPGTPQTPRAVRDPTVVVPFRGTFVLPEIAVADYRYRALLSIARHAACRTIAVGFDCIPVTSAEYAAPGMPGAFANYLAALAAFDEVVTISPASATEYGGWVRMLAGAGLAGPRVSVAELPFEAGTAHEASLAQTRTELGLGSTPIVLAVGSHEPRKNHLGLLHAAELLWRAGREFQLVMVGGNSWDSDDFDDLVAELRRRGRPLTLLSRASDSTVWALYRLARFSVFCSFNEGFGLPVAESLASGTPAITSDFGSMKQLAEGHGGLLVNPRDVPSLRDAFEALLMDDSMLERLRGELASLSRTSWNDYARTVWDVVTNC